MVAGLGGPTTSESTVTIMERVQGENQNPEPQTPNPEPLEDDDDEEVSWQSAARASLENDRPLNVKPSSPPITKKADPAPPKPVAKAEQPSSSVKPTPNQQETNRSSVSNLKSTAPLASSEDAESLTPAEQFVREELPADFWSQEEPPPTSSDDDEPFETATSAPAKVQARGQRPVAKLPFEMPLFNELQSIFPGRIVRVDVKQQKQAEESEEVSEPANEAISVVESED